MPFIIGFSRTSCYTREILFLFSPAGKRHLCEWWTILLIFKMQELWYIKKIAASPHKENYTASRGDTRDFTNDLTGMHPLLFLSSPHHRSNTWKTFRHARRCSLVLSNEKRIRSASFSISLSFIPLFSSLFCECSKPAASFPCITKRNTYFVLAHSFAFDAVHARSGRTAFFFFNSSGALWVKTILLNSFQRYSYQAETQISSPK